MNHIRWKRLLSIALAAVALLSSGCLHLDIAIQLHDTDGGGTITERIMVTRALRDLCARGGNPNLLATYLTKDAAEERAKRFGKGTVVTTHAARTLSGGELESVTVYTIPNFNDLLITTPYLKGSPASQHYIRVGADTTPKHKDGRRNMNFGYCYMNIRSGFEAAKEAHVPPAATLPLPTPLDRQIYRDLRPVIADLLEDLHIRMTVEVPTRFIGGAIRGIQNGPKKATLFEWSGSHHAGGVPLLENEEIMIEILRQGLDSPLIEENICRQFLGNSRVPVLRAGSYRDSASFKFLPTKHIVNTSFGGTYPSF